MITILSIDGGGIRGIIPVMILEEIEKQTGKPISTLFDYIAGTSTGGIIAAMLTVPNEQGAPKYTAENVKTYYSSLGSSVFRRSTLRKIVTLCGLIGPRYSVLPLERYLHKYLGNTPLHSSLTNVLIPAYDMESCTPWFFKSTHALRNRTAVDDPPLAQAAQATSAAPTYFRPCRIGETGCFIDGGVFASNPVLCAYAEAKKHFPQERDFLIVSLGTGQHQVSHTYAEVKKWGTLQWAIPLLEVLPNSSGATVDYQMKSLVGPNRYWRFQVRLDGQSTEMDDASKENIDRLEMLARKEIRRNSERIESLCRILEAESRSISS